MTYLSFVLDKPSIIKLLENYPARYYKVFGNHVTIYFPKTVPSETLFNLYTNYKHVTSIEVLHERCANGVQCVAVRFNSGVVRTDGSFYHITISCEIDKQPVDSNLLTVYDMAMTKPTFSLTGIVQLVK